MTENAAVVQATLDADGRPNSLHVHSAGDALLARWLERAFPEKAGLVDLLNRNAFPDRRAVAALLHPGDAPDRDRALHPGFLLQHDCHCADDQHRVRPVLSTIAARTPATRVRRAAVGPCRIEQGAWRPTAKHRMESDAAMLAAMARQAYVAAFPD